MMLILFFSSDSRCLNSLFYLFTIIFFRAGSLHMENIVSCFVYVHENELSCVSNRKQVFGIFFPH